jgi:hypothetical protein
VIVWDSQINRPGQKMPLAKNEVLQVMKKYKQKYWGTNGDMNSDLLAKCLANDVPEWSDLMIHFYCQIGEPRLCFSTQAKLGKRKIEHYMNAYGVCSKVPPFNWVAEETGDVFRYVMYTVGLTKMSASVDAFRQEDQDDVINSFYGVTGASNCHLRPTRFNQTDPNFPCGKKFAATGSPIQPQPQPSQHVVSGGVDLKKNIGLQELSLPIENQGLQKTSYDGADWFQGQSNSANCQTICPSQTIYSRNHAKKEVSVDYCETIATKVLGVMVKPFWNGTAQCESGCLVNFEKKKFSACARATPTGDTSISDGWGRLCPCQ